MVSGCPGWSARRPVHRPPAEHVGVHVRHALPGIRTGVEDDAIATIGYAFCHGHLMRMGDQVRQQAIARRRQRGQVLMVVARDHEYVNGSLRINITERNSPGISRHYSRWYLGSCNGTEQALGHADDLNVYQTRPAADRYGCTTANPCCTARLVQRSGQVILAPVAQGARVRAPVRWKLGVGGSCTFGRCGQLTAHTTARDDGE